MKYFDIYWDDLNEEAQEKLEEEGFQYDENMTIVPLFVLSQEVFE